MKQYNRLKLKDNLKVIGKLFLSIIGLLVLSFCVWLGIAIVVPALHCGFDDCSGQKAPPSIEVQTSAIPVVDDQPILTGFRMVFPENTIDWRVTYVSISTEYKAGGYTYYDNHIIPTYWCKILDKKYKSAQWYSCQPKIVKEE